jgi:ATP-dependent Lhr-like helicase
MDAFDRLSPAMRYQIVNSLGWSGLRPVQELSTHAILDEKNCVILAPTAGGKTESAFFPILSAMDQGAWRPVSTLYISPIRALLNNQDARLSRYTQMIGRRSFTWHGDITQSAKKAFVRDPADLLLTTPESIEVMLVSPSVPARRLFAELRAVIIDEVHAFVGDDRGGHLASLLERLSRYCGRDLQRIGLSATVGNPDEILRWLQGSSARTGEVLRVPARGPAAEVSLDYVGSVENAARVITALHPGRKRLVFAQSRASAEELTRQLRAGGVETFISHSSLSLPERTAAEQAFSEGSDCVIVATSALELGIDVGDLDHVLQVDAPNTVSSFLQRMGRTGRREGTRANCTLLATRPPELLQSAAMLRLWSRGYIEPLRSAGTASHLLAHQVMALTLQEGGVPLSDWWAWVSSAAPFRSLSDEDRRSLIDHMIEQGILMVDGARLSLGPRGDKLYGFRNFAELYSVFATANTLQVFAAGREIGQIETRWVESRGDRPVFFTLAGRAWRLSSVEWSRGRAHVVAAERVSSASWLSGAKVLPRALCAEQRQVLVDREDDRWWSRRAREQLAVTRSEFAYLASAGPQLVEDESDLRLWTFAGWEGNGVLAGMLQREFGRSIAYNNLALYWPGSFGISQSALWDWLIDLRARGGPTREDAIDATDRFLSWRLSKFQPCLPERLARVYLTETCLDADAAREAIRE